MHSPKSFLAGLAALIGLTCTAQADLIDLGLRDIPNQGNPTNEANWIETDQSLAYDLVYLWKTGADDGAVSGSNFTVSGLNTSTATISWDLTGTGYELHYVLLKDGSGVVGHYYHLYGVTPEQYVIGDSSNLPGGVVTINNEKSISHISFFGVRGTSVPDGGITLILLGVALSGIAAARRFVRA